MYYYWKEKGIRPSVFYEMPPGELRLIKAFLQKELEEKNRRVEDALDGGGIFPVVVL